MVYTNLSTSILSPTIRYIEHNFFSNEGFITGGLLYRSVTLLMAPTALIIHALDTIIGLGAGLAAICTGGTNEQINKFTFKHLRCSNFLLSRPYAITAEAINYDARCYFTSLGYTVDRVFKPLDETARRYSSSKSLVDQHVYSRLTYALLAIACLVTRAVDGIIGISAAAVSILTLFNVESVNKLSYKALQFPGIINDLFFATIKFINPWANANI